MHPDSNRNTIFRIQLTPYLDSPNPFQFDAITRDLLESGTILQIGRFTDRGGSSSSEINALGTDRLVFKSKVVSRKHAQIWVGNGGKFFIKDTKSSGGTFLNNRRLSLANQESIPFQLNDGDILQLGVDYRDGTDDFCKNVKIRVALWTMREVDASQVTVDRHHALLRTPVSASPTFQESESNESLRDINLQHIRRRRSQEPLPDETVDATPDYQQQSHEPSTISPSLVLPLLLALLKVEPITPNSSKVGQLPVQLMSTLLTLGNYDATASGINADSDVELLLDFIIYLLDKDHLSNHTMPDANRKARWLMFKLLAQRPVTPKSLFITGVAAELNLGYLGIGGFGCVFKGEYRGKQVAVKVLIDGHRNDSVNKDFCREALAWRSLSHDQHILPLLGIFEEGSRLFLVSPFMENGTLGRWRRSRRPSVEEIQKRIFEVAEGMQYIHSQGIVHGDLRGENVLLDASFHSRITDFGLTRHSDVTITSSAAALTLRFAAPELFGMCNKCGQLECDCRGTDLKDTHMRRKTSQTDVYAFGCLYYEIYFGIAPFSDLGEYQIIKRVTDGERPWRLETPRMGDVTWDLIQNCWAPNPSARPDMEDVVEKMTSIMRT